MALRALEALFTQVLHDATQQASQVTGIGHRLQREAQHDSAIVATVAGNSGGEAVLAIAQPGEALIVAGTDGVRRLDCIHIIVQPVDKLPAFTFLGQIAVRTIHRDDGAVERSATLQALKAEHLLDKSLTLRVVVAGSVIPQVTTHIGTRHHHTAATASKVSQSVH